MNNFKLDKSQKIKTGFTAPDAYFESFTDRLMQQLPQPEVKVVALYRRMPVWLSAAAAFVVMFTVGLFFITNTTAARASQPDSAAIENYLVYQTNVNSYDLIDHLNTQDIKELEASITLNDDAIKDYLTEEDVYTTY